MHKRTAKRKILYVLADNQGCGHYRCLLPAWYLQMMTDTYHTTCSWELSLADMYCYDMIVFQRHFEDKVKPLWDAAKDSGVIMVYETDDDFFNIRPINPAFKFIGNNEKQNVRNFMKMADAVVVSTAHLKEQMKCYNKNIYHVPNMIEINKGFIGQRLYDPSQIRIVYAGGPSHVDDFRGMEASIIKLLDDFGDKIQITFMGWVPECLKVETRIKKIPWLPVGEYLRVVASIQPHIGICPLEENIFNRSKSNMKWLEYTAVGAVTVASNVLPYQEVITTGVNGVLVDGQRTRDWYHALGTLVNNPNKIQPMAAAALEVMESKQLNICTSPILVNTMGEIFNSVHVMREKKRKTA